MGTQLPSQKGAQAYSPPIFSPCLLWPKGWKDQDGTWHGGRPRPRPHCVRWGLSPSPKKRGHSPQFSVHAYCGQTAGWIKKPLGIIEVGLEPRPYCARWWPSSRFEKSGTAPNFWLMSIVATVAHLSCCWALVVYATLCFRSAAACFCCEQQRRCLQVHVNVVIHHFSGPCRAIGLLCVYVRRITLERNDLWPVDV